MHNYAEFTYTNLSIHLVSYSSYTHVVDVLTAKKKKKKKTRIQGNGDGDGEDDDDDDNDDNNDNERFSNTTNEPSGNM